MLSGNLAVTGGLPTMIGDRREDARKSFRASQSMVAKAKNNKPALSAPHATLAIAIAEHLAYKKMRKEHIDNKRLVAKPLLFGIEEHVSYRGHAGQHMISLIQNRNNK